jgi:iron complex outermembrane receptor protein
VYASYNRGFRSGGFNTLVITVPAYEPETLDAYEIGSKNQFGWLTLNLAAYYYDYQDIQVGRSLNGLTGTYNAPGTEIYGADLDFIADISDQLQLSGGYSYVHGRYLDFPGAAVATPLPAGGYSVGIGNVSGNTTILSPEHSFTLAGSYTVPLGDSELRFDANYAYTSRYYHEPDNVLSQPAYSMLGGSITYETADGVALSLWGKNLTDEAVEVVGGVQTFGTLGLARASYGEPMTYGLTVSAEF